MTFIDETAAFPEIASSVPATPTRVWSDLQQAVFRACADHRADGGKSPHKVVKARAGTGKTTTIIEALNHFAPGLLIMLCAFNKKIAVELTARIQNPNATASTLHAIGFAAVRAHFGSKTPRIGKGDERAMGLAGHVCPHDAPEDAVKLVAKLCTKAREIRPLAQNGAELVDLAYEFECTPDDELAEAGYDVNHVAELAYECMELAAAKQPSIDFADMIFLPIRNRWLRGRYDVVVVDEAQDMTPAQLLLARGICKPGGRIIVVGDDRQAIYAFRGADSDSLDNLKRELGADELPLNVTYRCAKKIVAEAQRLVPDFTAHESNREGEIRMLGLNAALAEVQAGDFVLSRANAPLIAVALKLIREGRRTRIEGRDIGATLKALAKRLAGRINSMPVFLNKLKLWEEREIKRAEKAFQEPASAIEKITDSADTLRALAEGMSGITEMFARIDSLFSDSTDGVPQGYITCSSVHKAKGLEAPRVVLLSKTFKANSGSNVKRVLTAKQIREEENILYVAITRAKETLIHAAD